MTAVEPIVKNVVIVGDGAVGKTCLLYAYSNKGEFRTSYVPTIYEQDITELILDGERHLIKLHDTAGQEDYERLRQVVYKEADCFVLCYSVASRASFENIKSKWLPELEKYNIPIVLVGTKSDLKLGPNTIETEEGEKMCQKINANRFLECSAKNYENINEVFYEAVRATSVGKPEPEPDYGCHREDCRWLVVWSCCDLLKCIK